MLCAVCKKEISKRNKRYCSKECSHIGHVGFKHSPEARMNMSIAQSKNKNGKNIKCKTCKKQFYVPKKRILEAKFCSQKCSFLYKRGRPNIKSRRRVDKICKICGKEYWVIMARKYKNNYCSKGCKNIGQSKLLSGKYNPNWHNGIYTKKYGLGWGKLLRTNIKNRDNNVCLNCGESNTIKEVHHIDYNKNNNNELNLITLCKSCHSKTNFNRYYWIEFFKKIIIKRYGESI